MFFYNLLQLKPVTRYAFASTRFGCILMSSLLGSYFVILRHKMPKSLVFCQFLKVGSELTQTTPKVTFLALFYSFFALFLHTFCTKLHTKVGLTLVNQSQVCGRLKSTLKFYYKIFLLYIYLPFFIIN